MMRMETKSNGVPPNPMNGGGSNDAWELRPGGMLVQKRTDAEENRPPPPTIRVRVKYGSIYHQIHISSQATFGELKKMLAGPTGLHHQDQKLFYKNKERDSNAYLDTTGVKDKSKLVLMEDPISQEKRHIETRKNARMEKASKSISEISLEVDRFGGQVSAFESVISKGGKVAEKDLVNLIELLMNQLLKLDGINVDGDVKLQRKMQVKRVQKYIETLDMLKIKNSKPISSGNSSQQSQRPRYSNGHVSVPVQEPRYSNGRVSSPIQQQQSQNSFGMSLIDSPPKQQQQPSRNSTSGSFVITTQWETFDSAPAPAPSMPGVSAGAPSTSKVASRTNNPAQPSFNWDLL